MNHDTLIGELYDEAVAGMQLVKKELAESSELLRFKEANPHHDTTDLEIKIAFDSIIKLPAVVRLEEAIADSLNENHADDTAELSTASGIMLGALVATFCESAKLRIALEAIRRKRSQVASENAKQKAKLSDSQWETVMEFVRERTSKAGLTAAEASRQASAQLTTGQLIEGLHKRVEANTIAKRWSSRGLA